MGVCMGVYATTRRWQGKGQLCGIRAVLFSFLWVLEITLRPGLHGEEPFLAEPTSPARSQLS